MTSAAGTRGSSGRATAKAPGSQLRRCLKGIARGLVRSSSSARNSV